MNVEAEVLRGYTAAELKLCIKTEAGRDVAMRTIQRWRQRLDIRPNEFDLYTEKQADALVSLAFWLRSGRKIDHFISKYFDQLSEL